MQGHDPVEITQLEDATNPGLGTNHRQVAVSLTHSLQGADHDPEPERVDELDSGQIQDQTDLAAGHGRYDLLTEIGRTDHVEITGDGDHRPRRPFVAAGHDMHRWKRYRSAPRARDVVSADDIGVILTTPM